MRSVGWLGLCFGFEVVRIVAFPGSGKVGIWLNFLSFVLSFFLDSYKEKKEFLAIETDS